MISHPLRRGMPKTIMTRLANLLLRGRRPPSSDIGTEFSPNDLRMPLLVDSEVGRRIDAIPSETTPNERRFLYRFFATVWSGHEAVIEVGPFLGGTTRAIALGMLQNPRLSATSRLYTFDRFRDYYDPGRLSQIVKPLIDAGVLNKLTQYDSGEFLDLFCAIHRNEDYFKRVVPIVAALPDRRQDLHDGQLFLRFPNELRTDAVFVDGCKSWFGTKYFMCQASLHSQAGAHFIFQDYCWYTCFWIPAFLNRMKESFRLVGYVNTTYWFVLTRTLEPEDIEGRFPDEPSELTTSEISTMFDELIEEAWERNDRTAVVRHTLQKAGAFAYVGEKSEATAIITRLGKQPWASGDYSLIRAALHSPTYSPEGRILLE